MAGVENAGVGAATEVTVASPMEFPSFSDDLNRDFRIVDDKFSPFLFLDNDVFVVSLF